MKKNPFCLFLLSGLVMAAIPASAETGSWGFVQGNQYLTGNNDEIVPISTNAGWRDEFDQIVAFPVPVDNRVFVSSIDHNLYCLDARTGAELWHHDASAPVIRSAVVEDGKVVFVAGQTLVCLDAANGGLLWQATDPANNIFVYPIIYAGRVLYGTRKRLVGRDLATGRKVWENTNVSLYGGSMTAFGSTLVLQSRDYHSGRYLVTAVDLRDGRGLWETGIGQDNIISTPVVYEGRVYVSARNLLYCLEAQTGRLIWTKDCVSDIASDAVFASGDLLLSSDTGRLFVLDPSDGSERRILDFHPGRPAFAVVGENLFAFETATGTLYRTSLSDYSRSVFFRTGTTNMGGRFAIADGRIFLPLGRHLVSIGDTRTGLIAATPAVRTLKGSFRDRAANPVTGFLLVDGVPNKVSGDFSLQVPDRDSLRVTAIAQNYLYRTVTLTNGQRDLEIRLDPATNQGRFVLRNILFDFNSSDLKPESMPVLLDLRDYLGLNPGLRLQVRGHTDSTGDDQFNLSLSRRRAERVREFLVKNGVNEDRLAVAGLGESEPAADNSSDAGRALNRRIEFVVK